MPRDVAGGVPAAVSVPLRVALVSVIAVAGEVVVTAAGY